MSSPWLQHCVCHRDTLHWASQGRCRADLALFVMQSWLHVQFTFSGQSWVPADDGFRGSSVPVPAMGFVRPGHPDQVQFSFYVQMYKHSDVHLFAPRALRPSKTRTAYLAT